MGEVLGVGITHYPPLMGKPETYAGLIKGVLRSPKIPADAKNPENWPEAMQDDWKHEVERAYAHQSAHKAAMAKVRKAIDDFKPDAVIMFGDDQYENYKEDLIPPFTVLCMDKFDAKPFMGPDNIWGAAPGSTVTWPGAGRFAKELANDIIERDYPVAYAYKNLHYERGLSHAFANGIVYLDWDKKGWNWPIVPISVNCYGRNVISSRGGSAHVSDMRPDSEKDPYIDFPGPSGPTPRSCFRLGQVIREALDEKPGRYVVMASSGWSHAFLTAKHWWLYPDRDYDRARFEELKAGNQRKWADLSNDSIYDAGDQEFKNWICLAGAVEERTPEIVDYIETWIFNSEKCFALFPANGKGNGHSAAKAPVKAGAKK